MNEQVKVEGQAMPQEIRGWNWGAFLLNWIWGIGNNVWIALLTLVPCVGFVMIFVLGAKGNEWAWKSKRWESVEHFKRVQRIWSIVGAAILACAILFSVSVLFAVTAAMKSSDVYKDALAKVQANARAVEILGEPIDDGLFVTGNISVEGTAGSANFSFPVSGPKGKGTVYLNATKLAGTWHIEYLILKQEGSEEAILLPREKDGMRGEH